MVASVREEIDIKMNLIITFEQFMSEHSSCPRNRLIARIFYLAGFIESWGRGINKIKKEFSENGMEVPVYKEEMGGMSVYIKRRVSNVSSKEVSQKMSQKTSQKTSQKIIDLIKEDPNISTQDMADIIGIDRRNIARNLKKLQENGIVKRIGPDKGGYWEIVN